MKDSGTVKSQVRDKCTHDRLFFRLLDPGDKKRRGFTPAPSSVLASYLLVASGTDHYNTHHCHPIYTIVQSHDSFWVETFYHYYVEVDDSKKGRDDLLFYVKLDPKQVHYLCVKCTACV